MGRKDHAAKIGAVTSALLLGFGVGCAPAAGVGEEVGADSNELITTRSFPAAADAYVDSTKPSTNFGASSTLLVDTSPAPYRTYLRFDVPALTGTVTRATVRLWATDPTPDGPKLTDTTTSWSESALTWSNAPAYSGSYGDLGNVAAGTWVTFDVTTRVKGAGSYGFALVPTSADGADFTSRTTATPPTLVIETETVSEPVPTTTLACPSGFGAEVFRDDFNGTGVDTAKWQIVDQRPGGGVFTQLTAMRRENVNVSGGMLRLASKRHCVDPYVDRSAPENPTQCGGKNYYSGGWLKTTGSYAPGKGVMAFLAKMPAPVRGMFPALWARNTESGTYYTELDLIETWWDHTKGVAVDPNKFVTTTWFGNGVHTSNNVVGPYANLVTAFHVWEVEWDASASPSVVRYYYRDAPGAARSLLRTVTSTTSGFNGSVPASDWTTGLSRGFRPYIDFAVQPDTTWHVGPDSASVYDPADLLVDSVIVCKP